MPDGMIDVFLAAPLLRSEVIDELRIAAAGVGACEFVFVVGVRGGYVAVESGLARGESGQGGNEQRGAGFARDDYAISKLTT